MKNLFLKYISESDVLNLETNKDKELLNKIDNIKSDHSNSVSLKFSTKMTAGVLTYVLPSIPVNGSVIALINGLAVDTLIDNVNLKITGYTAGEIESDDELKVYY